MKWKVGSVAKTIVAGVLAAAVAVTTAVGDDVLEPTEIVTIALAVLTAFGVYVVPNAPPEE